MTTYTLYPPLSGPVTVEGKERRDELVSRGYSLDAPGGDATADADEGTDEQKDADVVVTPTTPDVKVAVEKPAPKQP